jgi:hypothetical protein
VKKTTIEMKLGKIYQYRHVRRMFTIEHDIGWNLIDESVGRLMHGEPFILLEIKQRNFPIAKILSKKGIVGWIEFHPVNIREYSEKPWS